MTEWKKLGRIRLTELPNDFWDDVDDETAEAESNHRTDFGSRKTALADESLGSQLKNTIISDRTTCLCCGLTFGSFQDQRAHFSSDLHKYNLQRRERGCQVVSELDFEDLSSKNEFSDGSLSGSEDGFSQDAETNNTDMLPDVKSSQSTLTLVQFRHPHDVSKSLYMYRVSLPDERTLASLKNRGDWAIIMSGGGHFAAAIWNREGSLLLQKTFHRYTSRQAQGGSQAVADANSGKKIRSAGAALRRHGEQQLKNDVRKLLLSWSAALDTVQCLFIRVNSRERSELLWGWDGSPLSALVSEQRVRYIPFPTRRATQREVCRVYEQLISISVSSQPVAKPSLEPETRISNIPPEDYKKPTKPAPKSKGTAHLKKKAKPKPKPKPNRSKEVEVSLSTRETTHGGEDTTLQGTASVQSEELCTLAHASDDQLALFQACVTDDVEKLEELISSNSTMPMTNWSVCVFDVRFFRALERKPQTEDALGLIGVAAVVGNVTMMEWLLDHGVSPCTGASPYIATKSKATRTALRKYWGKNPDKYDYVRAGIPSPITDEEAGRIAEKKRMERAKKRNKKLEKSDTSESSEAVEREKRAAAAERRLRENSCEFCQKSLRGLVPFERLAFKYCSTDCVHQHRKALTALGVG